jgi:uncharacterized protein (DUF1697 family)
VPSFVALLRSINVGGRNKIAMADLRDLVTSLGYRDVATYLQSGNVTFTGSGSSARAAAEIEQAIEASLGLTVPVIARSRSELGRIVEGNPYADRGFDPKTVHVTFLGGRPDKKRVSELSALAGQFGDDEFEVAGSEVYLHCPGGYGETKLHNAYLERRLEKTATTRNWRTVGTLAEMVG